jgi:hypothetical protein
MVNPRSAPATINLRLLSVSGQAIATGSGILNAGSHLSLFVNEMQTFAPGFALPPDFPDSVQFAALEITSTMPISLVGLRIIVNERGETLMTSTRCRSLATAIDSDPRCPPVRRWRRFHEYTDSVEYPRLHRERHHPLSRRYGDVSSYCR